MDGTQGSWAVVTGASSGIGAAFARKLAARGTGLLLTARRRERLELVRSELPSTLPVRLVVADLASEAGREELWQEVRQLEGAVELLVNNAGFGLRGPFGERERERELQMIAVNITAVVDLAHRYLALRRETGGGALLNVASVAGFRPMPYQTIYAATKSFVLSFSEALAEEVRPSGMRVLALCPGPVPTEFQEVAGAEMDAFRRAVSISAEQVAEEGLAALARGERVWVPGLKMRSAVRLLRLLPAGLFNHVGKGRLQQTTE